MIFAVINVQGACCLPRGNWKSLYNQLGYGGWQEIQYTDTTNGVRAFCRRYLMDKRVQPFRENFMTS